MHWRYRLRKQQLLDECDVPPEVFQGGLERLADFARPFAECLVRQEQRDHARTYLAGLVSDLKRKTAESIAYRHDQERHGLQPFPGRGTSWRWRCSRRPVRCCRMAGSPATTRWAARRISGP